MGSFHWFVVSIRCRSLLVGWQRARPCSLPGALPSLSGPACPACRCASVAVAVLTTKQGAGTGSSGAIRITFAAPLDAGPDPCYRAAP